LARGFLDFQRPEIVSSCGFPEFEGMSLGSQTLLLQNARVKNAA
jgi:hypothetical protein